MKTSNLLPYGLMAAAALALPALAGAATSIGIENSPHDFSLIIGSNKVSTASWNTRHGVCSPCHSAHHTDNAQIAPLWTHATTASSFTPYSSPSLNASVGQPDGVSLACLSCHDGTLAVSTAAGAPTIGVGTDLDANAKIGTDLHVTHPISFTYDTALATADGNLEDPATYKIGDPKTRLTVQTAPVPASWSGTSLTGKTIQQAMLFSGKMQWDDPEVKQAMEYFAKMLDYLNPDHADLTWDQAVKELMDGKVAFNSMGDWADGEFIKAKMKENEDFGWVNHPGTDGSFLILADGFTLAKGATHKESAIAWLRSIGTKEAPEEFKPI